MICPHCHNEVPEGRYCTVCGCRMPLTRREKMLIAVGAVGAGLVLALIVWFGFLRPDEPASIPETPSSAQEETSDTPETVELTESEKFAALPAIAPDNSLKSDWIVGTWKADGYTAKVEKVGDALWRWTKQGAADAPLRITADQNGVYSMTDAFGVVYRFHVHDFDELIFDGAVVNGSKAPSNYAVPWQALWVRVDENGKAVTRAVANEDAFEMLGETYAVLKEEYTIESIGYREGPLVIMSDGENRFGVGFEAAEDSGWGYKTDASGKLEPPPDEAVCFYVTGPMTLFIDSRKDSLTVDELAELIPHDSQPVIRSESRAITCDWKGGRLEVHYPDGSNALTNESTLILILRKNN